MKNFLTAFTFIFFIGHINAQLTSNVDFTQDVTCFGTADGSVQLSVSGGIPPYTFTISLSGTVPQLTASNTMLFQGLPSGTYNYEVEDANSDTHTGTFTITEPPALAINVTSQPDSCNQCVGSVIASAAGGVMPFQYSINDGSYQASPIFNGICEGNDTVTVQDANGCTTQTLSNVANINTGGGSTVGTVTSTPAYCNNGSLNITITSGVSPFEIEWITGDSLSMINNLGPGTYTVNVTDGDGCQSQFSGTVADSSNGQCSTISGHVYSDMDNNCMNNSEPVIAGRVVSIEPGSYHSITNENGDYALNVPFGNYSVSYGNHGTNCANSFNVTTTGSTPIVSNIDFADSVVLDVESFLNLGLVRPVIPNTQYLYTMNASPLNSTGDIYYVPDPSYTVLQTIPPHDSQNGDTLFWTGTTINATETDQIMIQGNTNQPLGSGLTFCSGYYPSVQESNVANNHNCDTITVIGSFDPNDKQVWPQGDIELTDEVLTYKIRFQNTGTDTAFNIFILDTLSQHLDPASFEFIAASHNCTPEFVDNNVLKFSFPNIMLVDSNTNEPLSHGHVIFRINQNSSNQVGDVIENTAGIYFDYNAPVITNTTVSPIVEPQISFIHEKENLALSVYPNPTKDQFTLQMERSTSGNIQITDVQGRTVFAKEINDKNIMIVNTRNWTQGVYLIQLRSEDHTYTEKVIVTN